MKNLFIAAVLAFSTVVTSCNNSINSKSPEEKAIEYLLENDRLVDVMIKSDYTAFLNNPIDSKYICQVEGKDVYYYFKDCMVLGGSDSISKMIMLDIYNDLTLYYYMYDEEKWRGDDPYDARYNFSSNKEYKIANMSEYSRDKDYDLIITDFGYINVFKSKEISYYKNEKVHNLCCGSSDFGKYWDLSTFTN
jgi:hypothetical protein